MNELEKLIKEDALQQRDEFMSGDSRDSLTRRAEHTADMTPFTDKVADVVNTDSLVYGIGKRAAMELSLFGEDDPNFDANEYFEKVRDKLDPRLWGRAVTARSQVEVDSMIEMAQDEELSRQILNNSGLSGSVASALGLIMDVDAALMFMSGGSYLGPKLAKMGKIGGSRVRGALYGAGAATEAGVISEVGNRLLRPTYESAELPTVVLGSMAFGAGIGGLTKLDKLGNAHIERVVGDMELKRQESWMYDTDGVIDDEGIVNRAKLYDTVEVRAKDDTFDPNAVDSSGSVGAAKLKYTQGLSFSKTTEEITDNSYEMLDKLGVLHPKDRAKWDAKVTAVEDLKNRLPVFRTDFDTAFNSVSPTLQLFGLQALESASGRVRAVNQTAAIQKDQWQNLLTRNIAVSNDAFRGWSKHSGTELSRESRKNFDRLVREEMHNRYYDGKRGDNEYVNLYADAMDTDFKDALKIMKNSGVLGAENLEHASGWMPQRWSGTKIIDYIQSGKLVQEQVELGLANGYRKMYPEWSGNVHQSLARAVIRRARALEGGMDSNMFRILQQDGRDYLDKLLKDSGLAPEDVDKFIDKLTKDTENKGKAKILRSRNEIDPRTPIPGSDLRIMDLMEDNLQLVNSRYARQAAGLSALSKATGINSRAAFDTMKAAVKDELQVLGETQGILKDDPDKFLETMWQHFSGSAIGEISDVARRMTAVSNLGLLNQMGLTQLAETGVIIAANGFESFIEVFPKYKEVLTKPGDYPQLMRDLESLGVPVRGEHNLIRPDLMLDEMPLRDATHKIKTNDPQLGQEMSKFFSTGGGMDNLLARGTRLQGFLSGFYAVRHMQTWLFSRTFLQHMGKVASGKKTISEARIRDMGFTDKAMYDRVMNNFNKHVTYDAKGLVEDLHLEKWDTATIGDFSAVMHRALNQNIQKVLAGEGSVWHSSDLGHLMMNLRSFTMAGLNKQTIRHARIADGVSVASVAFGVPIAGLVYAARQFINNNDKNLTPEKIIKGAVGYSNLTAPIPMLSDPFAALLGLDSLQFGMYGARDFSGNYEFVPGIVSAEQLNRMGAIPSSVINIATGNAGTRDISAIQSIPILGNAYGFNAMFNGLKEDIRADRVMERRKQRNAQTAQTTQPKQAPEPSESTEPEQSGENINALNVLDTILD